MIGRLSLLAGMILAWLILHQPAWALESIPPYRAFVTDTTGTLSASERQQLEQRLATLQQQQVAEFAILLVPTTAPETIFTYSMRVAEQWKVGSQEKDDGVLIVIALRDRTSQILVGYGLEDRITDVVASRILRDVVPPHFRQGDFAGGLNAAVDALLGALGVQGVAATGLTPSSAKITNPARSPRKESLPVTVVLFGFGLFMLGRIVLRLLLGRHLAGLLSSGGILIVSLLAGVTLSTALFLALVLFVLVAGDNKGRSRGMRVGGGRGGFGGGGGFSGGGGGRFGGGGASGRW